MCDVTDVCQEEKTNDLNDTKEVHHNNEKLTSIDNDVNGREVISLAKHSPKLTSPDQNDKSIQGADPEDDPSQSAGNAESKVGLPDSSGIDFFGMDLNDLPPLDSPVLHAANPRATPQKDLGSSLSEDSSEVSEAPKADGKQKQEVGEGIQKQEQEVEKLEEQEVKEQKIEQQDVEKQKIEKQDLEHEQKQEVKLEQVVQDPKVEERPEEHHEQKPNHLEEEEELGALSQEMTPVDIPTQKLNIDLTVASNPEPPDNQEEEEGEPTVGSKLEYTTQIQNNSDICQNGSISNHRSSIIHETKTDQLNSTVTNQSSPVPSALEKIPPPKRLLPKPELKQKPKTTNLTTPPNIKNNQTASSEQPATLQQSLSDKHEQPTSDKSSPTSANSKELWAHPRLNSLPSTPLPHSESLPDMTQNGLTNGELTELDKLRSIFRFSLKLSPYMPVTVATPHATSHPAPSKSGYLLKQSTRAPFPYLSNQWKRRYCVLSHGTLYLYEKETSKGTDRSTQVVDLKYFDRVAEVQKKKEAKKTNVFVVTAQDRSFYDPGRYVFAADTLTEMHDWIHRLRDSIDLIRNNNRHHAKKARSHIGGAEAPVLPAETADATAATAVTADANAAASDDKKVQERSDQKTLHGKQEQEQGKKLEEEELGGSEARVRDRGVEDAVDAKDRKSEKRRGEFALNLERVLSKEMFSELCPTTTESPKRLGTPEERKVEDGGSRKGSSTFAKKVVIQPPSPFLNLESKPQLESITKHRAKGPSGRRAPQFRRATLMKTRASSMSALQPDGALDEVKRDTEYLEYDLDAFEEDSSKVDASSLNSSQPILAYHYSSDEDSPDERECTGGSDRSFGLPPPAHYSSNTPPHTRPKSTSYNIENVPSHPVKGLRVYVPQKETGRESSGRGHDKLERSDNIDHVDNVDDLLEFRSLPRSLRDRAVAGRSSSGNNSSTRSRVTELSGSAGRLSSGRASPEMDALDNLLMKRSLHPGLESNQDPCGESDQEGSDGSTCKANEEQRNQEKELAKALGRFSSVLQHLQHHTARLECRTKQIETEFNISKNDVVHLQEATEGIRSDVKRLSESITLVAQEAARAKREYVLQRQETENLQKDALEALSQAQQSQMEFESTKSNYESTIKDLQSLISSIRASFIIADAEGTELKQHKRVSLAETGKSYSENDKSRVASPPLVNCDQRHQDSSNKKISSKDTGSQKGGYQSFFQRPSSILYGLTSRASNKSPNSNKKEKNDKGSHSSKSENEDKKKSNKQTGSSEKKQKGDQQNQSSLEKNKPSKEGTHEHYKEESRKHDRSRKPLFIDTNTRREMPSFSVENLPMMDDQCDDRRPYTTVGISHVSINVSPPSHNFNLEKSLSSPTVTTKFSKNSAVRPSFLNISSNARNGNLSHSNTSSPDSPVSPGFPYLPNHNDSKVHSNSMFSSAPAANASLLTTSSMSSVLDELPALNARYRQGIFAISKQKSSPNIPLQRQSSAPVFPLQRQYSLGTVPEEGQLPRQASLMSVPEDRPIVDRTLPLSPSGSIASFGLSLSPSGDRLDSFRERSSPRNSMELVTGPVVSGSTLQESCTCRHLPPLSEFEPSEALVSTSSLKKISDRKKHNRDGIVV